MQQSPENESNGDRVPTRIPATIDIFLTSFPDRFPGKRETRLRFERPGYVDFRMSQRRREGRKDNGKAQFDQSKKTNLQFCNKYQRQV
ncbi:MAG: hypothetical protein KKC99_07640, partial [Proteobacteria bacterium]|nr:hypothetical protein [Pseudomonadota bacterium]